jgi:hypothetical protein
MSTDELDEIEIGYGAFGEDTEKARRYAAELAALGVDQVRGRVADEVFVAAF